MSKVVPWSERVEKRTKKQRSEKQEKRVAKELGGRLQPRSGAGDYHKADVKTDSLLIEAKTTMKRSYVLQLATWEKLRSQAFTTQRIPGLIITFEKTGIDDVDLVVVPLKFLKGLLSE